MMQWFQQAYPLNYRGTKYTKPNDVSKLWLEKRSMKHGKLTKEIVAEVSGYSAARALLHQKQAESIHEDAYYVIITKQHKTWQDGCWVRTA